MIKPKIQILLSAIACILSLCLFAQPIITESPAPSAGDIIVEHLLYSPSGYKIGPGGAEQSWDYSNISGPFETITKEYLDPADLPQGLTSLFPNAALATFDDYDSIAAYFSTDASGLYLDGYANFEAGSPEVWIDYDPDLPRLPFQFGYDSISVYAHRTIDTIYSSNGTEYLRVNTRTYQLTGDAYGTLTTQAGTFDDVLRMKFEQSTTDSTFTVMDDDGVFDFVRVLPEIGYTIFQFISPESIGLLATIRAETDSTNIWSYSYFEVEPLGINIPYIVQFELYPNPTNEKLRINTNDLNALEYTVIDLAGKVQIQNQITQEQARINTADLAPGIYFLHVSNEVGVITRRFVIER